MRISCIITDTENIILVIVTGLKVRVTVIFLNEDIRERIILIIFIVCVQKGISDSVPVSIETNSVTTCKHSVLALLVRLQY